MKFGKQILAQQVPGWSAYYLDYKFLKKIVSSLNASRPGSEAAALALGIRPGRGDEALVAGGIPAPPPAPVRAQPPLWETQSPAGILRSSWQDDPPISTASGTDDERGSDFQAHKAAFFFKLERELEKINAFYLQKEAELKLRLETLMSKRRAAAMRLLPDGMNDTSKDYGVEWNAVAEGFRLLERDLGKLQQFIEINATGFRKILKKWDKRSKSTTKELYLARQVDIQPVFNRQLISELSDTVATCLLDLTDLSSGLSAERLAVNDLILSHQIAIERSPQMGPFHDLESNLRNAVAASDEHSIRDIVRYSDTLSAQQGGQTNVTRILWKAVIDAPTVKLADLILNCPANSFDFRFIDDINGRTCLHEAAMAGILRLVDLCLDNGVQKDRVDVYGRSALHYASMNGHADVCRRLIAVKLPPDQLDMDNYSPLTYATLKGHVDCARVMLRDGAVAVQPSTVSGDLIPLSLACQSGHVEVAVLLLEHGATNVPNSNGEYPIHLAAQQGHADICRLLVNYEGWDLPDKYNEWTPLFHASRYGRTPCVRVLIDAGSRIDSVDETGKLPVFYAAWYGHQECTTLLLEAAARLPQHMPISTPVQLSPFSDQDTSAESEIDLIPSLSLPPPIMPYRVYGHNYLDRNCLVQISIGHPSTRFGEPSAEPESAVQLVPRISGSQSRDQFIHASPLLKLVMTSKPDITSAPYSVALPLKEERDAFTFQVPSVDDLTLEFSIYPNFGTKTIGRAVALPSSFRGVQNCQSFVLPILDHHLHVVGEVSFEINVITPFNGVTLEIGGSIETYWKSMTTPFANQEPKLALRPTQAARVIGSTQTSPSNCSISMAPGPSLTLSSLQGDYLYVVVQVTRDLHPVVCTEWLLPVEGFDLGVADVTLAQFGLLASQLGRNMDLTEHRPATTQEWRSLVSHSLVSLECLLEAMPSSMGIALELAFPTLHLRERHSLGRRLDLNDFVYSVLRVVYQSASPSSDRHFERRRVVFTSFAPDVCAAVNWKQPNYSVFFASRCGTKDTKPPSATSLSIGDVKDRRLSSLGSAVEFAKSNNLLGVFLDADLLLQVPSLIQGVRDAGLLVGTYGQRGLSRASGNGGHSVDAVLQDGIITYVDHAAHGVV